MDSIETYSCSLGNLKAKFQEANPFCIWTLKFITLISIFIQHKTRKGRQIDLNWSPTSKERQAKNPNGSMQITRYQQKRTTESQQPNAVRDFFCFKVKTFHRIEGRGTPGEGERTSRIWNGPNRGERSRKWHGANGALRAAVNSDGFSNELFIQSYDKRTVGTRFRRVFDKTDSELGTWMASRLQQHNRLELGSSLANQSNQSRSRRMLDEGHRRFQRCLAQPQHWSAYSVVTSSLSHHPPPQMVEGQSHSSCVVQQVTERDSLFKNGTAL
jgi:hypothetical protein